MQLIANGPDIPDALLQAHEDGRVVFFCGAGISYPAGLPGFKGLVDKIYELVGTVPNSIEQEVYDRNQFDATLDLLERRLPGQRLAVRQALFRVLQPKLRRKGATDTHNALLDLAKNREGALRLVTTNFDRVFARLTAPRKARVTAYPAPLLPIPKSSRWNGLVYLHGLLPTDDNDATALNRLVLTSGDFGLAYLTERWAARFVSELFRNYTVCFVGYSINDPVLRYMMDALAADRMLGEITPQAYAFGDVLAAHEHSTAIGWRAKGVTPILYEVPTGTYDHSRLHQTLKAWAETYRDGTLGKERMVVDYAMTRPSESTGQDDFVGRMLWALSDESGLPAKQFADFNPVPPLDWLAAFSEKRYRHGDLFRFGVSPLKREDENLNFSLIRRPAPYDRAPLMSWVSYGLSNSKWDDRMAHLARWLIRHLDDSALIFWLSKNGGCLHTRLADLIEDRFVYILRLEHEGKTEELERIVAHSPNAVPRQILRPIWRLLLANRVKSSQRDLDFRRWKMRFMRDGLTATLRFQLRELLAPKVVLRKPFHWHQTTAETDNEQLKDVVEWELVLATEHLQPRLSSLQNGDKWRHALPILLYEFQQLLIDALDLAAELGDADSRTDRSYWDLPSISPHRQNRGFRNWVTLIELLRDAWLAIRSSDPKSAAQIAENWCDIPYPTFKRLALFAASHDGCIASDQWVHWLVNDDGWWLWSEQTRREALRLLVLQGRHLTPEAQERLEAAILSGPPREMYPEDIEPNWREDDVAQSCWLRLAKLNLSGATLGDVATERLAIISAEHPNWQLAENERDEFAHWMSVTGDPDIDKSRYVAKVPRRRSDLVAWLRNTQVEDHSSYKDNWGGMCRDRFFLCALALCDLAREGIWPVDRWRIAFQAWSEERHRDRSRHFITPLIDKMPSEIIGELSYSLSWWLQSVSESPNGHESVLLDLCRRLLDVSFDEASYTNDSVNRAINHPVGHVTRTLLNLWFKRKPNDHDKLPCDLEPLFSRLCDTSIPRFLHARVLLASRLIPLFRADRTWTEHHLLPLFDWNVNEAEACAVWQGFLWGPRLYLPLLIAFKRQFLDTAHYYSQLREYAPQFAAFLAFAALEPVNDYTVDDFRTAIGLLPQEGLEQVARALVQALEGAGDQREEYWSNRVKPFWKSVWPKTLRAASKSIAESLAHLSIGARAKFPDALAAIKDWLQPLEDPDYVVHLLDESALSQQFPEASLSLLNAIIGDQPWPPGELRECLEDVSQSAPNLMADPRYVRLAEYLRQRGD